ncbi:Ldh family oxidoreductase [Shimia sp. R10_1]|uniref:Ldh family oxidoreductase n=1 Tax=Shimia sp. R10_1 TaxID=2821095 RepID=UPI001ADAC524|nr:Ldh family oxidoreductase [Shimia sp. R10_1]MBO9473660.1 Ldh family oxidoreductase [Shimia sp. R10_1]
MPDFPIRELQRFSMEALTKCGVPLEDAEIVTESIVFAHTTGKGTHGLGRLPIYLRKIQSGLMRRDTPLKPVVSALALEVLDADHGFGQVAAVHGMQRAISMSETYGVGLVGIRHSNNFGTAAFIASAAVKANKIGIVMSNAAPAISAPGSTTPILGTNPLAFGFPSGDDGSPIVFDMAISNAARGKIRLAAANGEEIPEGWAVDENGVPTTSAEAALAGAMLPIGGAKGYGLALSVDILAGLLTGSAFGGGAKNLDHKTDRSDCGHFLLAIDVSKFMALQDYQERISRLSKAVKSSGSPGVVILPGERSRRYMDDRNETVPLTPAVVEKLDTVSAELGLPPLESIR